jgi:hypothetical protein
MEKTAPFVAAFVVAAAVRFVDSSFATRRHGRKDSSERGRLPAVADARLIRITE